MTRRLTIPAGLVVAVALLLLPQAAAPPTASAAATAYNTRVDYLRFPVPDPYYVCTSRRIYLASGNYTWDTFYRYWADTTHSYNRRIIWLRAGWYRWTDCNGRFELAGGRVDYFNRSRLVEEATAGAAETWWALGSVNGPGNGSYEWGSSLTPQE